jgi:hypothetical protein
VETADGRSDALEVLLAVAREFAERSGESTSPSTDLIRRVFQIETDHLHAEPGERSTVVATVRQIIEQSVSPE